jgi:cell division inhibitor SepF
MAEGLITKIKKWVTEEEVEEVVEDDYELEDVAEDDLVPHFNTQNTAKNGKILNIHATTQMKVVIFEPKSYDEAPAIADHLKHRKAVIVNLENLDDPEMRKSIFHFISGAVYVLDGSIQKVSKAIFILAPSNVDIDANMKKELETKVLFPWQNK